MDKKQVTHYLPDKLHKQVKIKAIKEGKSVTQVIEEQLTKYLKEGE